MYMPAFVPDSLSTIFRFGEIFVKTSHRTVGKFVCQFTKSSCLAVCSHLCHQYILPP